MLLKLYTELIPESETSRHFIFTRKLNSTQISSHESESHSTHVEVKRAPLGADLPSTLLEKGSLCHFIRQATQSLRLLENLLSLLPIPCWHTKITHTCVTHQASVWVLGIEAQVFSFTASPLPTEPTQQPSCSFQML